MKNYKKEMICNVVVLAGYTTSFLGTLYELAKGNYWLLLLQAFFLVFFIVQLFYSWRDFYRAGQDEERKVSAMLFAPVIVYAMKKFREENESKQEPEGGEK